MAAAGRRTAIRKGEVATRPLMFSSTRTPALLYCHDGNKNVSDMVTVDGTVAAHYEYSSFGKVVMAAFVAVPGFSGVCLSNALSVCAWVNADSLPPFAPLAVRASDLCAWADGFGLYVGESGGIGAYVRSGDDGNAAEGGILSTGIWNHVAMTYSGTELKLYVNGKPVSSRTFQTAASADASAPLAIGSLRGKMGEPQFTGAIADVRVWSKALSPQEVRAAYLQFIGEAIDPSSDDDGDGMPNGWEVRNGFDPRDPVDADLDSDGDGVSNLQECRLGRNPRAGMVPSGVSLIKSGTAVGP